MRFSAAVGRQVVGSDAADTIGQVAGFVVDPAVRRVVAVQVKKPGEGTMVPWANIGTFGDDAVIVGGPDAVGEPDAAIAALTGRDHTLIGKRVLTTAGTSGAPSPTSISIPAPGRSPPCSAPSGRWRGSAWSGSAPMPSSSTSTEMSRRALHNRRAGPPPEPRDNRENRQGTT
ncbi:PRC-barrel domain-containing protein [Rhodococcus sp. WAY2]|uniref:PRC-barrel domain-containing protein n=1 Tax=Rhodococcus sp. WAY2 TaxID=2663121 RepID=UPI00132024B0|nr:PRC-barrel domain-containing protein [Rhodococcus sp. WAY2]QHE72750.1 hypothetical protein GFS60_06398 [Rhodococcus sp. WAY2]